MVRVSRITDMPGVSPAHRLRAGNEEQTFLSLLAVSPAAESLSQTVRSSVSSLQPKQAQDSHQSQANCFNRQTIRLTKAASKY